MFPALTTIEIGVIGDGQSTNATWADSHAFCSSTVIGREALARSSWPRQKRTEPVPVPENAMLIGAPIALHVFVCHRFGEGNGRAGPLTVIGSLGARSWQAGNQKQTKNAKSRTRGIPPRCYGSAVSMTLLRIGKPRVTHGGGWGGFVSSGHVGFDLAGAQVKFTPAPPGAVVGETAKTGLASADGYRAARHDPYCGAEGDVAEVVSLH